MSNLSQFSVVIEGKLEKYNEVLSKARCRIFYLGHNRNGGYITEEFANKLLATISYVPVKGIYDEENEDFSNHGDTNSDGRVYGVVPENPNLTWEKHMDKDGIERVYATVDILLYTAIYKEASEIIGKAQSMELYRPSIKGSWQIIDGKTCYKYEEACFLGLQTLGDDVEPCFEGAAFFSLYDEFTSFVQKLEKHNSNFQLPDTGGKEMQNIVLDFANYELSFRDRYDAIWNLLNPEKDENGYSITSYSIIDVFDDYVLVKNYKDDTKEKIAYTVNEETEEITLGDSVQVYTEIVTKEEKEALATIRKLNNNSLDVSGLFEENKNLKTEIEKYTAKTSELEQNFENKKAEYSALETTVDELKSKIEEFSTTVETLKKEKAELASFKNNIILNQKNAVIEKYENELGAETISTYKEKIDEFSLDDLKKELAFELVQSKPSLFSTEGDDLIPKGVPEDGLTSLLNKYKKN